jgi:hypothetical protein
VGKTELVSEELSNRFTDRDRKLDHVINKTNYVIDEIEKIIGGLNMHLKETDCEHCKEVLRKIFSER